MLLPPDSKLFEPTLKRTALKKENEKQQDEVGEQRTSNKGACNPGNLTTLVPNPTETV